MFGILFWSPVTIVQEPNFWLHFAQSAKQDQVLLITTAVAALAVIVTLARPKERGEVRTAGGLFALSLMTLFAQSFRSFLYFQF